MRKILIVILLVLGILGLSSCDKPGKQESLSSSNHAGAKQSYGADLKGEGGSVLFNAKEIALPEQDVYIQYTDIYENNIYLFANVLGSDGYCLYLLNIESEEIFETGLLINESVIDMKVSPDGDVYVLIYHEIENSSDIDYCIRRYDINGTVGDEISLEKVFQNEKTAITSFLPTNDYFIVSLINSVIVMDYYGDIIATFSGMNRNVVLGNEGQVLICGMGAESYIVEELAANGKSSYKYLLDTEYALALGGTGSKGVYLTDNSNIYSVDYKHGERQVYINILANNLNEKYFKSISEEKFFSVLSGKPYIYEYSDEESNEVVILKMATFNMDWALESLVLGFNSTNGKYKIDVIDYSIFNTGTEQMAGLTKLNTEIISGNLPDIFDLSLLPSTTYSRKGFLEDLIPFIDCDIDLNISDFVGSVISAATNDGKMYELIPGFSLMTLAGSKDVLSASDNWDISEFLSLVETHGGGDISIFPAYLTQESFIEYILAFTGISFFNSETGKCHFDNDGFKKLIEFSSTLPSNAELNDELFWSFVENEHSNVMSKQQLLSIFNTGKPTIAITMLNTLYQGNINCIGFPSNTGSGVALNPFMRLAMASTSTKKDEIWEFFKYLLSDDYQNKLLQYQQLPVIHDILVESLTSDRDSMQDNSDNMRFAITEDNELIEINAIPLDGDPVNYVLSLIDRIDCINQYDTELYQIIVYEVQSYYSGQKNIDEVISIVQKRAEIYMSEQYQ